MENDFVTYEFSCGCGQSHSYVEGKSDRVKKVRCPDCDTTFTVKLAISVLVLPSDEKEG